MARTTPDKVREIVEVDEDVGLSAFIDAANQLVTEKCTSSGYSDARLESIETWLAAHFYKVFDREESQYTLGAIGGQFFGKVDIGLRSTHYGQQALRLDTAGNLAAMDNAMDSVQADLPAAGGRKGGVTWLGTDPAEQETY